MTLVVDDQGPGPACPFDPRPGVVPRTWFGRRSMLDAFTAEMDRAEEGHTSRSPLFVGATGLGKSALLTWSTESAIKRGWPAIRLTVSGDARSPAGFARSLSGAVTKLGAQNSVVERAKMAARKIPVRPQIPYLEYAPRASSSDTELIEGAFRGFDSFVTRLRVPGLLAVDELHQLEPATAEALVHWLSDERGSNVRLVAAGLSSSWPLVTMDTMSLGPRVFRPFELIPLTAEQSREFILRALESVGASWPDQVVDRAAHMSWGSLSNLHDVGYKLWLVNDRLADAAWVDDFMDNLEREMVRDLKRRLGALSRAAQRILNDLREDSDGLPLFELRMSHGDHELEFRRAMDQLETAGLATLDPDQYLQLVGPRGALDAIANSGAARGLHENQGDRPIES